MSAGLILEILVAVLLVVTIAYCFILNRRLGALRNGQGELYKVVEMLNEATNRANAAIDQLRRGSKTIAEELMEKTKAGRALADELGVIVESGNSLAERLTASRSAVRKPDPIEALSLLDKGFRRQVARDGDSAGRASQPAKTDIPRTDASSESELRLALKAMR